MRCLECGLSVCKCVYCHDCYEQLVGGCRPARVNEDDNIVDYGRCVVLGKRTDFLLSTTGNVGAGG